MRGPDRARQAAGRRRDRRSPQAGEATLGFLPEQAVHRPADVLSAALDAVIDCAQTAHGDIQTVTPGRAGLDLVRASGFFPEFVDHFAHVDGDATACAIALMIRQPITIPDVTTSGIFDHASLEALTAEKPGPCTASSSSSPPRADVLASCRSTMDDPARSRPKPPAPSCRTLASRTAGWLGWYGRTATLEDLHRYGCRLPE